MGGDGSGRDEGEGRVEEGADASENEENQKEVLEGSKVIKGGVG